METQNPVNAALKNQLYAEATNYRLYSDILVSAPLTILQFVIILNTGSMGTGD